MHLNPSRQHRPKRCRQPRRFHAVPENPLIIQPSSATSPTRMLSSKLIASRTFPSCLPSAQADCMCAGYMVHLIWIKRLRTTPMSYSAQSAGSTPKMPKRPTSIGMTSRFNLIPGRMFTWIKTGSLASRPPRAKPRLWPKNLPRHTAKRQQNQMRAGILI